jgi:hypothetical protein
MTFLLCDLCVLLRPVHFWLWLGRPGKSVVPFPALVPMAEPFRFTSGVSVSPREGTRLTETGPKARILQARRPPRAFFNGLLTELERLFGRGSTKRPSLTGLNGGGQDRRYRRFAGVSDCIGKKRSGREGAGRDMRGACAPRAEGFRRRDADGGDSKNNIVLAR